MHGKCSSWQGPKSSRIAWMESAELSELSKDRGKMETPCTLKRSFCQAVPPKCRVERDPHKLDHRTRKWLTVTLAP